MKMEKRIKRSFAVIGREGSTADGQGSIQKLWADANARFDEVRLLGQTGCQRRSCLLLGRHV